VFLGNVLSSIDNPISKFKEDVFNNHAGDLYVDQLTPLLTAIVAMTFLTDNHLDLFDAYQDELNHCRKAATSLYKDLVAQYPSYRRGHRIVSPILSAVAELETTLPEPKNAILKSLNSIKKVLPRED